MVTDIPGLLQHAGTQLGTTEWQTMTQSRVDQFAEATDDRYYIHVDTERAAQGRFGTTIAHGYLTLSLVVPAINELLTVEGVSTSVNYGLDRVRFPAPMPVGARYRASLVLAEVTEIAGGVQMKIAATVEVENREKPALVAECLFRHYA
jgi:acyl dehydratase